MMTCEYCGCSVVVPPDWRPNQPVPTHYSAQFPPPPARSQTAPAIGIVAIAGILMAGIAFFFALRTKPRVPYPPPGPKPNLPSVPKPADPAPESPGFAKAVLKFGGEGVGAGLFKDARAVAVDGSGNIYVGEYLQRRVQVFDPSGKFVTQWTVGPQMEIQALAADRKGNVYIQGSGTIWRFEGATGKELGHMDYPGVAMFNDVVTTPDGGLLASQSGIADNIVRFDAAGRTTLVIRKAVSTQSETGELDLKVATDGIGHIYALSSFSNAVYKFSMDGKYVSKFGSQGTQQGQFTAPQAIAVDPQGRVYVSDFNGIQVFDSEGRYLNRINSGLALGMVINDKNELFTAARTQIVKYAVSP